MAGKQIFNLSRYFCWLNDRFRLAVFSQNASLAFREREILKPDPKRDYPVNTEIVRAEVVTEKLRPEMTPAAGPQFVHLFRGNGFGVKFFVDVACVNIGHRQMLNVRESNLPQEYSNTASVFVPSVFSLLKISKVARNFPFE